MRRLLASILALLTAFAALTSGALNGRVLCMGDAGHLAVEDPHAGVDRAAVGRCAAGPRRSDTARDNDGKICCRSSRPAQSQSPQRSAQTGAATVATAVEGGDADRCVDVASNGTLVHESAAPAFDNAHALVPLLPQVLPPLATASAADLSFARRSARAETAAGTPPALADLACLRVIVLLT